MKRGKLPEYKVLVFKENKNRTGIYDLQNSKFRKFKYFRLSEPKSERFKRQGAKYIIESWDKKGDKVLFSGFVPMGEGFYYGDHKNTKTGKKSMFFAKISAGTITLYYFNSFSVYPSQRLQMLHYIKKREQGEKMPHSQISIKSLIKWFYKGNKNDWRNKYQTYLFWKWRVI